MKISPKVTALILAAGVMTLIAVFGHLPAVAQAQTGSPSDAPAETDRPFKLPFAEPASLETWLMGQPYGNTTGAYRQRYTTYGASGGIHFGLDLAAPCGTEVVAIADGVVFAVDGPFGSPPHNLMIDHPQLGYASMYGHLLEAPKVRPGQAVKQGEVVALTGDSAELCYRRPHLHLEIRDLAHIRKFNPIPLIDADWDNLALVGSDGRDFARDLTEPRKWQTLYEQPQARTAGPIINDFDNPWPLDWEKGVAIAAPRTAAALATTPQATTTLTALLKSLPAGQQITTGNCCTQPFWSRDSSTVQFIDKPGPDQPAGLWGVDVSQPEAGLQLVSERLGVYSPDATLVAYPSRATGLAVVERVAGGIVGEIDTQGRNLNFSPDSQRLLWATYDEDAPRDTREEIIWLAEIDGSSPQVLLRSRRTDALSWLADDKLLMTRRIPGTSDVQLFSLTVPAGRQQVLVPSLPRMRGVTLSPDKRYMVYYASLEEEAEKNGVWLLDLENPTRPPEKLPFFGTYRWRDSERLIYISFDPEATEHSFYEYNVGTKQTRPLFPAGTGLLIANNDWKVSPDGSKIALVAADGSELDGVWMLDIAEE